MKLPREADERHALALELIAAQEEKRPLFAWEVGEADEAWRHGRARSPSVAENTQGTTEKTDASLRPLGKR
ncbi:MAG: hypothetical protein ABI767_15410 [Rhodanobacter sp.]